MLARQPTSKFARELYLQVLDNIFKRKTMQETLDHIIKECFRLINNQVPLSDLITNNELNQSPIYHLEQNLSIDQLFEVGYAAQVAKNMDSNILYWSKATLKPISQFIYYYQNTRLEEYVKLRCSNKVYEELYHN